MLVTCIPKVAGSTFIYHTVWGHLWFYSVTCLLNLGAQQLSSTFWPMIQSYILKCSQSSQTNHKLTGYRNKRSAHKWKQGAYIGRRQQVTGERLHGNVWRGIFQHVPTIAWHQGLLTGDDATSHIIVFYCSPKKIQCSSVRIVTNLHAGHQRNRGFCKTSRSAMGPLFIACWGRQEVFLGSIVAWAWRWRPTSTSWRLKL